MFRNEEDSPDKIVAISWSCKKFAVGPHNPMWKQRGTLAKSHKNDQEEPKLKKKKPLRFLHLDLMLQAT